MHETAHEIGAEGANFQRLPVSMLLRRTILAGEA